MKIKNIVASETISPYSLAQSDNYKSMITAPIHEILDKYVLLVIDYMLLIAEKIYIKKSQYYKYIFIRGLDTITSVFKFILFYTKNLDLAYFHSQKAFYFYVEFIEQISNDQNTFLQLSSREACLFVYKKTIYELINDYKKNNMSNYMVEYQMFEDVNKYLIIYKNIVIFCINNPEFTYENKLLYINECSQKFKTFSQVINNNILPKNKLQSLEIFIDGITDKTIKFDQLISLGELFIKKIFEKKITYYTEFTNDMKSNIYFIDSQIKDDNVLINQIFNGSW